MSFAGRLVGAVPKGAGGRCLSRQTGDVVKVELRDCGTRQELYVNGVFVLEKKNNEEIYAREALEAVCGFCGGMEFWADELDGEGTLSLFDGRFFSDGYCTGFSTEHSNGQCRASEEGVVRGA